MGRDGVGEARVRRKRRGQPGAIAALDEGVDLVTQLPSWVAVLWATALPSRFVLAGFLAELATLGPLASGHREHLLGLAYASLGLWLLSLYGRQLYVRACRRAREGDTAPGLRGLRVPPSEMAGAVGAALLVELTFWALLVTILVPVAMVAGAALAATAAPRAGPRLGTALKEMALGSGRVLSLALLLLLFFVGLLIAFVNLHLLFVLSAWFASLAAPLDGGVWGRALNLSNPLYFALLGMGATLLVEPFWLAAVTVHVERVRSQSSGEDLRQAFEDIRRRDARAA